MKKFHISLLVVLIGLILLVETSQDLEFHYIRTEKMNDTNDFFSYDLKKVNKINETAFEVDCDSELFVNLDNEWHMWVQVFHNPEGKEEFGEKPLFQVPKKGVCDFMASTYRNHLFDSIKEHSNLPHPDECPVTPRKFEIKNWIFNPGKYRAMARPGMYRIDLFISQDHEESHVTKLGVRVLSEVKKIES